jgi:sugar phosphate isomerase/epimerase
MAHYDLLATCWTTAGDAVPLPGRDVSPLPLRSRVEAAAAAGFTGFGLMHADLAAFLETSDLETLQRLFDDNGISSVELEFLTEWWLEGPQRKASDETLRLLMTAAEVLRPHHVKVGPDIHGGPYDNDQWAEQFHRVCEAFASVGTPVALEFMPFANISTLQQGTELVETAGHPNGGLMVDLWHVRRGGLALGELARVPPRLVTGVEMDDGAGEPDGDPYTDTVLRRRLCGQGDFDVPAFINVMLDLGWDGPWGVEILSETYRVRPLAEAVQDAYTTARDQFTVAEQLRSSGQDR